MLWGCYFSGNSSWRATVQTAELKEVNGFQASEFDFGALLMWAVCASTNLQVRASFTVRFPAQKSQ